MTNFLENMIDSNKVSPLDRLLQGVENWKSVFPKKRKEPTWKAWSQLIKEDIGVTRVSLKSFNKYIEGTGLYVNEEGYLRLKEEVVEQEVVIVKPQDDDYDYEEAKQHTGPLGPTMLECGHNDWYTEEEHELAKEKGMCCAGQHRKGITFWNVRGLIHPVPNNLRRENIVIKPESSGYCTHPKTGLYIGGFSNNCLYNKNTVRCKFHEKE